MSAIDSFLVAEGASIYYSDSFRNVLEDHMSFLRSAASTTVISIDPIKAYRFEFDLSGLLLDAGISLYLHWVIMRMNGLTSPQQVSADLTQLLIPSASEIEMLRQSATTAARIS